MELLLSIIKYYYVSKKECICCQASHYDDELQTSYSVATVMSNDDLLIEINSFASAFKILA